MLPPEECQCGKAAGGCSSRPAFFKEKIFDFLHYTRITLPPEECQCGKAAGGCSSRPAFFREKIFDFLQYSTKCGDCPLFSLLSDALIRQGRRLTAKAADYAPHVLRLRRGIPRVKSSRPPFAEKGPGRFFRICGGVLWVNFQRRDREAWMSQF